MINQQSELLSSFVLPIHSANDVLNRSLESIKQLFAENEMYDTDFIFKDVKVKYLEIRFVSASLTCMFNEDKLCTMSYLFLDDLETLNDYIQCCNSTFSYDYVLKEWLTPNGTASVKSQKEDIFFVFCSNHQNNQ